MHLDRRTFLQTLSAAGIAFFLPGLSCRSGNEKKIKVTVKGANSERGHALRSGNITFDKKISIIKDTIIIGGGVSGLSCAYHLIKNDHNDVMVLELADEVGGNSVGGENAYSKYPYGAHYLTLPNKDNKPLIDFLHEHNIITAFDKEGIPVFNESDLCFDPEERLFIKGVFQEGLIPDYGVSVLDKKQVESFLKLMDSYKEMRGSDGKYFFDIPYSSASIDTFLDDLDKIPFSEFLKEKHFTSEYLLWYLDYCCRDDFGGGIEKVSAWAGINYFASHKPVASNTDSSRVLTWPEGNKKLIDLFSKKLQNKIQTACLVKEINIQDDKVFLTVLDFKNKQTIEYTCNTCVVAVPPFINNYILNKDLSYPHESAKKIKHVPWMTAAVTLESIPLANGLDVCWDNVGYKTKSLGYIYDQHQDLSLKDEKKVITLYIPLDEKDPSTERKLARERTENEWKELVISELAILHPGIEKYIEEIEIWTWGHAMALPEPGIIKSNTLKELAEPVQNKIFFAHTDLTGYSVFEEGFDWGYRVAQQIKNIAS